VLTDFYSRLGESAGDGSLKLMRNVLLFEEERGTAIELRHTLEDHGYFVRVTANLNDVHQMLESVKFDLIIVNILLATAFKVVETAKERGIRTFVMTGSSSQSS